jgi:very-short-patch-repair endonuclease
VQTPPMLRIARELRSGMTAPERTLWSIPRRNQTGLRFRRQHPLGRYVLDFYCASAKLCVEIDGPAHEEWGQIERDAVRDTWLNAQGITVVRFTVTDVNNHPAP